MKSGLIHVAGLLFNEPLAILPEKLESILRAIGPRLDVDKAALDELLQHPRVHDIDPRDAQWQNPIITTTGSNITITGGGNFYDNVMVGTPTINGITLAQMPDQNGDGDSKPYRLTPEGIAVIPIRGTLMKRFNFLSAASGCSTYASLAQAANTALSDPQVKAVLFDVDSPGGTTHGCFELADMLYGMRGEKPMWGVANDLAASAAYALGSSLDRLWLTRTGGVGSVGVFALHADQSAQDEQAGIKYTYISAGKKKTDGNPHEPLSKSARSDIQAEVDRENAIFVATVARNRGFAGANAEKIQATEAGVYFAQNATPLLADEVGTFEEALEALTAKVNGSKGKASGKVAFSTGTGDNAGETMGAEVPAPTPATSEKPDKEGKVMAKQADEEMKRAKKTEAEAEPDDAEDDEDDDDKKKPSEDEDAKKSKKAAKDGECDGKRSTVTEIPVAADNSARMIADLCIIGGVPELTAEFIVKGYSVEKVMEKLSARRAKASAEGAVNSYVAGDGGGTGSNARASVDSAIEQARVMSANSGGRLTQSQCMEKLLRANPAIYESYMAEKDRVMSQIPHSGSGPVLNDYVLNQQRRYMANLGLSTVIDNVPGKRAM